MNIWSQMSRYHTVENLHTPPRLFVSFLLEGFPLCFVFFRNSKKGWHQHESTRLATNNYTLENGMFLGIPKTKPAKVVWTSACKPGFMRIIACFGPCIYFLLGTISSRQIYGTVDFQGTLKTEKSSASLNGSGLNTWEVAIWGPTSTIARLCPTNIAPPLNGLKFRWYVDIYSYVLLSFWW